jgi:hypothetical protein
MGYDPDRAAFIAAIMIAEAEEGMKQEKFLTHRWHRWNKIHEDSIKLISAYDGSVNKNDIYATAARVIEIVNRELQEETTA